MSIDRQTVEAEAALTAMRRRARDLAQAEGAWSRSEVWSLIVPSAMALYFIFKGSADWPGDGIFGMVLLLSVIGGWQHRRLTARVDALTRLLADMHRAEGA